MAVALEHDDVDLARRLAERLGDGATFSVGLFAMSIASIASRPDGDLLHVDGGAGEEHRAALGDGDHRDRARLPERGEPRALERIDRDVDLRPFAVPDLLAVVEHRRLVLLPLADHDDAAHRDAVEDEAHRVDRGPVGALLLAAADPARGGHRAGLRDADELQRDVAVGGLPSAHASHPLRCLDPDEVEAARDHGSRRTAEAEPERLLLALEHAVLVVEAMEVVGDADRVGGNALRAALRRARPRRPPAARRAASRARAPPVPAEPRQ